MAGKNGGARPGAGRKPKSEKYRIHINGAEKRIADRLPFLIDQQFKLASGVPLIESSNSMQVLSKMISTALADDPQKLSEVMDRINSIFSTLPDRQAIQYLLDRIMGKPTEHKEVTGENGGAVEVTVNAKTELLDRIAGIAARIGASEVCKGPQPG